MKKNSSNLLYILPFVAVSILVSCNGKDAHEGHNHGPEDNHATADHNHDEHEGHDHAEATSKESHADEIIFTKQQAEKTGLQTLKLEPRDFNRIIRTSGQIQAAQGDETTIVATTSGVISFNNAATTEGSAVKGGEAIVTISSKNIADGDPAAKARIAFNTAQKDYDRAQELVKDQIISQKEFDAVKSNFETARLSYQALAKSQSAQGTRVTAPISGYLKSRLVNEGEFVSVGQPIAVISQNKQLQLRAEVPEKYYKELSTITSANFKTPYDNTVYELSKLDGRLVSFGKASGNNSFYIPVTFAFNNVGDIVPGSFVEVFLISSPIREALIVPLSALVEEQGVYYVFIQLDEEGYRKQEVTLGGDNGSEVQILSGLKPGEVVVTKGAMQVKLASMSSAIPHGHSH